MTETIALHPSAAARFNEIATEVLGLIEPSGEAKPKPQRFEPETYPAAHFGESDIEEIRHLGTTDPTTGDVVKHRILANDKEWVLGSDGCRRLGELIAKLHSRREIASAVSPKTTRTLFLEWAEHCIAQGLKEEFTDFALAKLAEKIENAEMWVPIANLHVQSPMPFGEVVFKTISADFFDSLHPKWLEEVPSDEVEKFEEFFTRKRQKFQGLAAAAIRVKAEPEFAVEAAYSAAERSTSLLRLFARESLEPTAVSYVRPAGTENILSHSAWNMRPSGFPVEVLSNVVFSGWSGGLLDSVFELDSVNHFSDELGTV